MPAILDVLSIDIPTDAGGGVTTVYFRGKASTYAGIKTETGVGVPTSEGEYLGKLVYPVKELSKSRKTSTFVIYYKVAGVPRRSIVFCAKNKADAFLAKDGTLTYKGDSKARVREPRRRTRF